MGSANQVEAIFLKEISDYVWAKWEGDTANAFTKSLYAF